MKNHNKKPVKKPIPKPPEPKVLDYTKFHQSYFEAYKLEIPLDADILYEESDANYSWSEYILIYKIGEKIFKFEEYCGGECGPYRGPDLPEEVTMEEAIEAMEEFEEQHNSIVVKNND